MPRRDAPAEADATAAPPVRSALATAALALAALALGLAAAESIARARGRRPWTPDPVAPPVEPGGSLYVADPLLGFALRPGGFRVTLAGGLRFRATHDALGHRITRPVSQGDATTSGAEIWIFGDSFSYGWSVSDDESYPWLLQSALPRHRVTNFAVGGYGTLQSLLQLEAALRSGQSPALVVLAHNFFHDSRNTFSSLRRREVVPWNRLGPILHPAARLGPDGALVIGNAPVEYAELPLMRRSALANLAATAWDLLDDRRLRGHEVTRALVARFIAVAHAHGATVVFTTLEASPANEPILAFAASQGARAADVSLDLRIRANTNLPYDGHPSALAQRRTAKRLAPVLREALAAGRKQPGAR
jgi:lysophospholipase L1-like esterase